MNYFSLGRFCVLGFLTTGSCAMWVIYLEAFGILALVLFIVWWTMRGKR